MKIPVKIILDGSGAIKRGYPLTACPHVGRDHGEDWWGGVCDDKAATCPYRAEIRRVAGGTPPAGWDSLGMVECSFPRDLTTGASYFEP